MQGSHAWRADSAVFDEDDLVSHAGLAPLLAPAERTGLPDLLDEHVRLTCERVKSGAANAMRHVRMSFRRLAIGCPQ
jgi:hypothetical protein